MERSLLVIASLMVSQIFEALYINCELGSGVIRKVSFLFDSKYKEYKDIGILSVLNVSMLQWCTYKLWTVMRFCLFNNGIVFSFSQCSWQSICSSTGRTLSVFLFPAFSHRIVMVER